MEKVKLNKTKRQKKEYYRMIKQMNYINNWMEDNYHIIRKGCNENNINIFQLYNHYNRKLVRLKNLLHI